jgi:YegS/Rv2252/BmrU family lipid kinase
MTKKKLIFIINPVSGVFKKGNIVNQIKSYIDTNVYDYRIEYTEEPGHATEICHREVENGANVIVAVGGDGSVNEIAKGLVGTETCLAIIPAGSGNGLAHHLKIPLNHRRAIEVINKSKKIKIDTGKVNKKLFVSIAGIGFDALVAKEFAGSKWRGFLTYMRIVAEKFPNYKPKKYEIEIDGEKMTKRALFISFANSDQFGYMTPIAPDARVDDGLLDVIIMEKFLLIDIPILANLLFWRKIDKSKYVEIHKGKEIKVRSKKKRWVNIDGEAYKLSKELNVSVLPQSLNIIVP